MLTQIDHLVIVVETLDEAIARYREFGFTVTPGGQHASRATHNALVAFGDGAYLELIAYLDESAKATHRWGIALAIGPGLIDACLASTDLASDAATLRDAGLHYAAPNPMARQLPDGRLAEWVLTGAPADAPTFLPFLIHDTSPRDIRVPGGDATVHANGVTGIDELVIGVHDLDIATATWSRVLGTPPAEPETRDDLGGQAVTFRIGSQRITLATPDRPDNSLAEAIALRGDAPFRAYFAAADTGLTGELDIEKAQGARLAIRRD